jgi:hypothetical protein
MFLRGVYCSPVRSSWVEERKISLRGDFVWVCALSRYAKISLLSQPARVSIPPEHVHSNMEILGIPSETPSL